MGVDTTYKTPPLISDGGFRIADSGPEPGNRGPETLRPASLFFPLGFNSHLSRKTKVSEFHFRVMVFYPSFFLLGDRSKLSIFSRGVKERKGASHACAYAPSMGAALLGGRWHNVCSLSRVMIGKIENPGVSQIALSSLNPSRRNEGPDFHSVLQERMEQPFSLPRAALEALKRAVDLALSEPDMGKNELFLSPPLFPYLTSPPRENPAPPPDDFSGGTPAAAGTSDFEVSNYLPAEADFETMVREAGQKYRVDPSLIKAVIQVESGGNPLAVSPAGARGLMQLTPQTAFELGVVNPFNPLENVMAGTRYLRSLLDRYHGDLKLALAAYNWGMGNLEKRPQAMPRETRNYVAQVEDQYRRYSRT